jgi:hypothetical protein
MAGPNSSSEEDPMHEQAGRNESQIFLLPLDTELNTIMRTTRPIYADTRAIHTNGTAGKPPRTVMDHRPRESDPSLTGRRP